MKLGINIHRVSELAKKFSRLGLCGQKSRSDRDGHENFVNSIAPYMNKSYSNT